MDANFAPAAFPIGSVFLVIFVAIVICGATLLTGYLVLSSKLRKSNEEVQTSTELESKKLADLNNQAKAAIEKKIEAVNTTMDSVYGKVSASQKDLSQTMSAFNNDAVVTKTRVYDSLNNNSKTINQGLWNVENTLANGMDTLNMQSAANTNLLNTNINKVDGRLGQMEDDLAFSKRRVFDELDQQYRSINDVKVYAEDIKKDAFNMNLYVDSLQNGFINQTKEYQSYNNEMYDKVGVLTGSINDKLNNLSTSDKARYQLMGIQDEVDYANKRIATLQTNTANQINTINQTTSNMRDEIELLRRSISTIKNEFYANIDSNLANLKSTNSEITDLKAVNLVINTEIAKYKQALESLKLDFYSKVDASAVNTQLIDSITKVEAKLDQFSILTNTQISKMNTMISADNIDIKALQATDANVTNTLNTMQTTDTKMANTINAMQTTDTNIGNTMTAMQATDTNMANTMTAMQATDTQFSDVLQRRFTNEGTAVLCAAGNPGPEGAVYRYTNGELRHYPGPDYAFAWDPYWGQFETKDCTGVKLGPVMKFPVIQNPPETSRKYSSIWDNNVIGTGHARSVIDSAQAWSAKVKDGNQWMTIDAGSLLNISGVVTQRRADGKWANQYVKLFRVSTSIDGIKWTIVDGGASFNGPQNESLVVNTKFPAIFKKPVTARYVRIQPVEWINHISMRAGLVIA